MNNSNWNRITLTPFQMAKIALLVLLGLFLTMALLFAPERAFAAFPGENGKIVFSANGTDGPNFGQFEICTMYPDGSGITRLTNVSRDDISPVWSPDGSKIAFVSSRSGNAEIYVMNADGSGQTRLTYINSTNQGSYAPSWSPDGSKIAYTLAEGSSFRIFVMNSDGSNQTALTSDIRWANNPAWSPDGTRIAFDAYTISYLKNIWVMNADGSGKIKITDSGQDTSPSWSPDGQAIVFARGLYNGEIYSMHPDGSSAARLTNNTYDDQSPAWSPDGAQIAFNRCIRDGSAVPNDTLYVINADGSSAKKLTSGFFNAMQPDWGRLGCAGSAPGLSLRLENSFWGSYADYLGRLLSVSFILRNAPGSTDAINIRVVGSASDNGVVMGSSLPLGIGSINGDSSGQLTLKYLVPTGVHGFLTTTYVSTEDTCGNSYSYP